MSKYTKIALLIACGAVICLLPVDVMAVDSSVSNNFNGDGISNQADKISKFMFGPVAKFVAALGGGYGLITSIATGNPRPLLTFGGIGLTVAVVPEFIKGVFTLILP